LLHISQHQFFQMSLEEFKAYVSSRGVSFDELSKEEKRVWGETFDRSRHTASAGKLITKSHSMSLNKL
jgi:hypothetical protein